MAENKRSDRRFYGCLAAVAIVALLAVVTWPLGLFGFFAVKSGVESEFNHAADALRDDQVKPFAVDYVKDKYGIDAEVVDLKHVFPDSEGGLGALFDPASRAEADLLRMRSSNGEEFVVRAAFGNAARSETGSTAVASFSDSREYDAVVWKAGRAIAVRAGLPEPLQVRQSGSPSFFCTRCNIADEDGIEADLDNMVLVFGPDVDLSPFKKLGDRDREHIIGNLYSLTLYRLRSPEVPPAADPDFMDPDGIVEQFPLKGWLPQVVERVGIFDHALLDPATNEPSEEYARAESVDRGLLPVWGEEGMERTYSASSELALSGLDATGYAVVGDAWKVGAPPAYFESETGLQGWGWGRVYVERKTWRRLVSEYGDVRVVTKRQGGSLLSGLDEREEDELGELGFRTVEGEECGAYIVFDVGTATGTVFAIVARE